MAKSMRSARISTDDPTALGRAFKCRLKKEEILLGGIAAEYIRPSLAKISANAGYHFVFVDKDRSARGTSFICPRCAGSRRRSTPSMMWRCPSISVCRRMPSVNP